MKDYVEHSHRRKHPPCRVCYVAGCRCDQCRAAERTYNRTRTRAPRVRYRIVYRPTLHQHSVLNGNVVVYRARTLLECENWVTRGGADEYENNRTANVCSTMGGTTARQNGGAGGELELPPAGRSSTREEPT